MKPWMHLQRNMLGSKMKIVQIIRKDKELQKLKEIYKRKYNKNAPPFNYDEYYGIEDYKEKLKLEIIKAP